MSAKNTNGRTAAFSPTRPRADVDQPIDGAVGLRDAEEERHPREQHQDADREALEHRSSGMSASQHSDAARGREHDDAEVHPAQIGDGEDRDEDGDREEL